MPVSLTSYAPRFGLEFGYSKPPCGSLDARPPEWWYRVVDDVHYLHFGVLLWALSTFVAVAVSLVTEPIPEESLYRLTFWSRHSTKVRVDLDAEEEKEEIQEQIERLEEGTFVQSEYWITNRRQLPMR